MSLGFNNSPPVRLEAEIPLGFRPLSLPQVASSKPAPRRSIAFLAERDLGVDLFVADARTGEVRRRLVSTDVSPHFDALRFADATGDWSPDGSKFVFAVSSDGDTRLAIVDVASGEVEREGDFGEIAITSSAWSPDGRTIVFSGLDEATSTAGTRRRGLWPN